MSGNEESPALHAVAGAGGGIISMILTYPLITVSLRAQVNRSKTAQASTVKGQWDAVKQIIREEGVAGLYSGLASSLFGIAVTNGIYYYWYEAVKGVIERAKETQSLSALENIVMGAIAGSATAIMTNPIWVVNTRMMVKKESLTDSALTPNNKKATAKSMTTQETVLKILQDEGIQGFFRGIAPALILVANPIIQYTVFEQLKAFWERRLAAGAKLGVWDFFILGAISKICATGVTYPYIVIKSRMQLRSSSDPETRYASVADGFRKIIKNEGVPGLYKGIQSKLLQSVLTSAFLFMAKEQIFNSTIALLVLLRLRQPKVYGDSMPATT